LYEEDTIIRSSRGGGETSTGEGEGEPEVQSRSRGSKCKSIIKRNIS
jgi:hypothetical protein